jgi:hypothetical protein
MNKIIAFHAAPSKARLVILSKAKDLKVGTQDYQFSKHQKLKTKHGIKSYPTFRIFPCHSDHSSSKKFPLKLNRFR